MATIPPYEKLLQLSHAERLALLYAVLEDTHFESMANQVSLIIAEALLLDQSHSAADLAQRLTERLAESPSTAEQFAQLYQLWPVDGFVGYVSGALCDRLVNLDLYKSLVIKGRPEKRLQYWQTARQQATRLQNLARDLVLLGQLDSGAAALHLAPTDLNELVREVVRTCQTQTLERDQTVTLDLLPDVGLAELDADWISRALRYLVQCAQANETITCSTARCDEAERSWLTINFKLSTNRFSVENWLMAGEIIERHGGRWTEDRTLPQGIDLTLWLRPAVASRATHP